MRTFNYANKEQRTHLRDQCARIIGQCELMIAMSAASLELAQKQLEQHRLLMQMILRHDTGIQSPEEREQMFDLMETMFVEADKIEALKSNTADRPIPDTLPAKRSRKRGLQEETIKPTDDLT